jgi:hypothetical protein
MVRIRMVSRTDDGEVVLSVARRALGLVVCVLDVAIACLTCTTNASGVAGGHGRDYGRLYTCPSFFRFLD